MDSNYEAQRHLTTQKLDARREQAAAERLLRQGQQPRASGLSRFFSRLFRHSGSRQDKKHAQKPPSAALAAPGKRKR